MATANHLPGYLGFVSEEDVLLFHLRHNVRMLLHSLTTDVLAVDGFTNFDEALRRALEDKYGISRLHRLAMPDSWIVLDGCGCLHTYTPIQMAFRGHLQPTRCPGNFSVMFQIIQIPKQPQVG
jgi:hypothetical protein